MSKEPKAELQVARLPNAVGSAPLSGAVQAPQVGWLSVRVTFLGEPVAGLAVAFHARTPEGKCGDAVSKGGLETDAKGVASHDKTTEIGSYFCKIEHQPDLEITTVPAKDRPLDVILPVGRTARDLR